MRISQEPFSTLWVSNIFFVFEGFADQIDLDGKWYSFVCMRMSFHNVRSACRRTDWKMAVAVGLGSRSHLFIPLEMRIHTRLKFLLPVCSLYPPTMESRTSWWTDDYSKVLSHIFSSRVKNEEWKMKIEFTLRERNTHRNLVIKRNMISREEDEEGGS